MQIKHQGTCREYTADKAEGFPSLLSAHFQSGQIECILFLFLLNVIMFYCKVQQQFLSCLLRIAILTSGERTIISHQDCTTKEELQTLHSLDFKWLEYHFRPRKKDPLPSVSCCPALGCSTWHAGFQSSRFLFLTNSVSLSWNYERILSLQISWAYAN